MSELTVQEAALAWAQGKKVEAATIGGDEWLPIDPVGECLRNTYAATVFSCPDKYSFRFAPVPPTKQWRPWTAKEVPVGAQVRYTNNNQSIRMLIVSNMEPHLLNERSSWTLRDLFRLMEHSLDHGKTWLPCGVEVVV